jgi:hypothetical protein
MNNFSELAAWNAPVAREGNFRCKAFSGEGVRLNRIRVEKDGSVLVWDSVAGHFTTCHSLSAKAQDRLRAKMALRGSIAS